MINRWPSFDSDSGKPHHYISLKHDKGHYILSECTYDMFMKISKGYLHTLEHEELMKLIFAILYKHSHTFKNFDELYKFLYPYDNTERTKTNRRSNRHIKKPFRF